MKRNKFFLIILWGVFLLLMLTSCKKKNEKIDMVNTMDKEHVFKEESLDTLLKKMSLSSISQIGMRENRIYAYEYQWTENQTGKYKVASIDFDGENLRSFDLEASSVMDEENHTEESISYNAMCINNLNQQVFLKNHYVYNTEDYSSTNRTFIVVYSNEGELIAEQELLPAEKTDYVYYSSLVCTDSGTYYLLENDKIIVQLNSSLQREKSYEITDVSMVNQLLIKKDTLYAVAWSEANNRNTLFELGKNENGFSTGTVVPETGTLYPGNEQYDFIIVMENKLKGWNRDSLETTEIMNYIDSDASISNVEALICKDKDFLMLYNDLTDYKTRVALFQKVEPQDVKEKKVIRLACLYTDYQVKKQVYAFNKSSDIYRIQIVDYGELNAADANAGITKLNMDIMSDNAPDILIGDERIVIENYAKKGLLTDLTDLMNAAGIDTNDYASNILSALSLNGKLISITPSFSVQTYGAKESVVGNEQVFSLDAALELCKAQNNGTSLFDRKTKQDVLREGLQYLGTAFIDKAEGTCNFNSSEFMKLLQLANMFPAEIQEDDEEYFANYDSLYRDNRILLMNLNIYSIADLNYQEQGRMGEKIKFTGFPSENGIGAYINPGVRFSVFADSTVKEGAWSFIGSFLTEEYQSSDQMYGLPILKSQLDKQIEKATSLPFYLDDDGNKVEYEESYFIGDQEIKISPMTKQRAEEILNYVLSVNKQSDIQEQILSLIEEEAAAFFAGDKLAEETAAVIQSRVQIFMDEQ